MYQGRMSSLALIVNQPKRKAFKTVEKTTWNYSIFLPKHLYGNTRFINKKLWTIMFAYVLDGHNKINKWGMNLYETKKHSPKEEFEKNFFRMFLSSCIHTESVQLTLLEFSFIRIWLDIFFIRSNNKGWSYLTDCTTWTWH